MNEQLGRKNMTTSKITTAEQSVSRELGVHGHRWAGVFDGYFSDANVARPLLDAVEKAIEVSKPDVLADLGGGTGFLLAELLRRGMNSVRLVDVDLSEKQLSACANGRIAKLQSPLNQVTRRQLMAGEGKLLLMSRSMLHYFGRDGIDPLLKHLHRQLNPGEIFVHQSACFARQEDADLMSHLYERMETGKWFFTTDELTARLENAGFSVRAVTLAPSLEMSSVDLGERYDLDEEEKAAIRMEIEEKFGCGQKIFAREGKEFRATLCYCIFTCEAM
ncbi:MAG: class I SAM-dependent methyltransferase [Methanothrix sp.]|nr:MAG: class I SAM-dependent methyltransferase [Methanothrix sp.]